MKPNRTAFLDRVRTAVQKTRDQGLPWKELIAPADDQSTLARLAGRDREQHTALLQQLIDNAAPLNPKLPIASPLLPAQASRNFTLKNPSSSTNTPCCAPSLSMPC